MQLSGLWRDLNVGPIFFPRENCDDNKLPSFESRAIYLLITYLGPMLVYSLGEWAFDESSPLDPALRHADNFQPGVPHVSPPGVS